MRTGGSGIVHFSVVYGGWGECGAEKNGWMRFRRQCCVWIGLWREKELGGGVTWKNCWGDCCSGKILYFPFLEVGVQRRVRFVFFVILVMFVVQCCFVKRLHIVLWESKSIERWCVCMLRSNYQSWLMGFFFVTIHFARISF